jgi:hypothetical protein
MPWHSLACMEAAGGTEHNFMGPDKSLLHMWDNRTVRIAPLQLQGIEQWGHRTIQQVAHKPTAQWQHPLPTEYRCNVQPCM